MYAMIVHCLILIVAVSVVVIAIPDDWAPCVASGDMAFTLATPSEIGEGLFPVTGNGYLAIEQGPFLQRFLDSWPYVHLFFIYFFFY